MSNGATPTKIRSPFPSNEESILILHEKTFFMTIGVFPMMVQNSLPLALLVTILGLFALIEYFRVLLTLRGHSTQANMDSGVRKVTISLHCEHISEFSILIFMQ